MSDAQRIDVLAILDARAAQFGQLGHDIGMAQLRDCTEFVAELIAAAEDARSALHSCIDALSSDEQSDHDALARVTAALVRAGASS